MKTIFITIAILLSSNKAFSEWAPQDLISKSLIRDDHLWKLSDMYFMNLKSHVAEYLRNSWCSEEKTNLIMDLIILEDLKTCVEIGVFTGSSFLPIAITLRHLKSGKAYAIDAWSKEEAIRDLDQNDPNWIWWSSLDMNNIYDTFQKTVTSCGINKYTHVFRETSESAASKIDEIDFLHLDGNNFSAAISMKDAELYVPKVKSGGYILCSNVFYKTNASQPKLQTFLNLLDICEIVCEVDSNNTILLKKN